MTASAFGPAVQKAEAEAQWEPEHGCEDAEKTKGGCSDMALLQAYHLGMVRRQVRREPLAGHSVLVEEDWL